MGTPCSTHACARRRTAVSRLTALFCVVLVCVLAQPDSAVADPARFSTPPIVPWRLNGQGWATLVVGNTVYVGGGFSSATAPAGGSVARANLAAFDATTGALVQTFRAETDGPIRALATDGSRLFLGGNFGTVNGVARQSLAAVDLSTGVVDAAWRADASSTVWALTREGGQLYVGGAFTTLAGQRRTRLAALDATTGVLTSWSPSANNSIRALAADPASGLVYAGGRQTAVNGLPSSFLTKIDAEGQVVPGVWLGLDGYAQGLDLSADGTRLAVAGADNETGWYDTATGARGWVQHCDGNAQAIKVIADSVVSGFHDGCNNVDGREVMINNQADGARDGSFLPIINSFWGVRALDGNESVLVTAGSMTMVDGVRVGGFAIFRAP